MPVKKKATPKSAAKKKPAAKNITAKKTVTKKETVKKTSAKKSSKKESKVFEMLRGMKDVLPKDSAYWMKMHNGAQSIAESYGFMYHETPVLENANLFISGVGKTTDIVEKEMYIFEDKDGKKVAMRPEGTAPVVRSYVSHGMFSMPQPVKLWGFSPMFRHDRPQAGRFRQFHQFSCETIGAREPVIDAELISIAYNYLRDLGLNTEIHVNSIGTLEDRQNYLVELTGYLRSKKSYLSEESKKRLTKSPLRILDSKDEGDQEVVAEAPQIIDWLSVDSKDYFMKVLEYLDELQIPYVLDATLVRGLDYYSDTVFEIFMEGDENKSQGALGGGGRYDALVQQLGGSEECPGAAGFGIGVERVLSKLRVVDHEKQVKGEVEEGTTPKVFFAQLGHQGKRRALYLIEHLRRAGVNVGFNFAKSALKSQLELANKFGATHAVILGQKEVLDGTVILRDMSSGIQEIIDQNKLEKNLKRLLGL